jgi:diguanylate cyclase (GGDEF)-like protein
MWRVRYTNFLPLDFADETVCAKWSRREWGLIHSGYLLWTMVTVIVAVDQGGLSTAVFVVALAVGLFGSAGSVVFSVNFVQLRITLAVLHWPAILALAAFPDLRILAVILTLHWLSSSRSAKNLAREYDAQINLEYALLVSRAEVQALARTDALTGLANRHEYVSMLNWAWLSAQRSKSPLAMAVIDLDHFKAVNDTFGHPAGDACLKHVAGLLRHHFRRADDFVARIGGEEFVAILPSTTIDVGLRMCEEFRVALGASTIAFEGRAIKLTASIGVGDVSISPDIKPDVSFARIDAATYQAKALGRNQTVVAASGSP